MTMYSQYKSFDSADFGERGPEGTVARRSDPHKAHALFERSELSMISSAVRTSLAVAAAASVAASAATE